MKTLFRVCTAIALLVAVLAIAPSQQAYAGTATGSGYVGGVSYISYKTNYYYTNQWWAELKSTTSNSIEIIGYTYWTIREQCFVGGQWIDTYYYQYSPGQYNTNSTLYLKQHQIYPLPNCSGQRKHYNLGNHDYSHSGQHIYPYLELVE